MGVSFGGGTGGGVWLLVSTASAALYVHYSVYVLEPKPEHALSQPAHHNCGTHFGLPYTPAIVSLPNFARNPFLPGILPEQILDPFY